jgi:hypothetical protein
VTAIVVKQKLGGELVSTRVGEESHWFNRVTVDGYTYDVDLTGDQFGFPPVQIASAGALYGEPQLRALSEVHQETMIRAGALAQRAGLCFQKTPSLLAMN